MKHIKRFILTLLLIFTAYAVVNYNTSYFTDISHNLPYLAEINPDLAESIMTASKNLNDAISEIPSLKELIAKIQGKEVPIDPDDVAENIYFTSDTMLNFYDERTFSVSVNGDKLEIYGKSNSENDNYLVFHFLDENGEILLQDTSKLNNNGEFVKSLTIPNNTYQLAVFTSPVQYGEYTSVIYDYIYLERNSYGNWEYYKSPVYDNNVMQFEKSKSMSLALENTYTICHKKQPIIDLAVSITNDLENDYEKAVALHDWVCRNIYYDTDSIEGLSNNAPYVATDVLNSGRAVCLGYANLYAALCRSINIPCNVVTGHALGVTNVEPKWDPATAATVEANHAWNEVYLDNHWVIVDTTWDSKNKIVNDIIVEDKNISHLYFDANLKFFSTNHRIDEYII